MNSTIAARCQRKSGGKPKIPEVDSADLTKGELFIEKLSTRSIGRDAVKSIAERGTGSQALIGLENDSMERLDVAADHAEVVRHHATRMTEIGVELSCEASRREELTEEH